MPFTFTPLTIPGVILIEPKRFADERGFFMETYQKAEFARQGITTEFVQDNVSVSRANVLRGLHYQKHLSAQAKLVTVLDGEILDVVVDIRQGSPTFGQSVTCELSGNHPQLLYVPVGFAHGFLVTGESATVHYKVSAPYDPGNERGILWRDPALDIDWRIPFPILSPKDEALPLLREADNNFTYQP